MTRLGLIAYATFGGLSNQTWEVFRHLHPETVLVLRPGQQSHGPFQPHRFIDPERCVTRVADNPWVIDDEIRWLVHNSDVIYCAETTIHEGLNRYCDERGVRLILHANPELFAPAYGVGGVEIWNPTFYRDDLLPRSEHVPFPVSTDLLPRREITQVHSLLHVSAPAMLDRNGTEIVTKAMHHLRYARRLVTPDPVDHYPDLYREGDALVLPRRYAGMCLTMQEAAAVGLPLVMLESDPNAHMTIPELLVRVSSSQAVRMKGGTIAVHDADPQQLAAVVDRLEESDIVARAVRVATAWADAHSWEALLPEWRRRLGLAEQVAA